jgi:hypothetical protein
MDNKPQPDVEGEEFRFDSSVRYEIYTISRDGAVEGFENESENSMVEKLERHVNLRYSDYYLMTFM